MMIVIKTYLFSHLDDITVLHGMRVDTECHLYSDWAMLQHLIICSSIIFPKQKLRFPGHRISLVTE